MALPKLNTLTYELTLPSTGKELKFRPFLVKEQKALMIAQESEDDKQIENAFAQIINDCTFGELDAYTIPMFDVEYVFLRIRSKSVGEISKLKLLCPDDKKTYADVEVNLEDVQVQVGDEHTNKIDLGDGKGVIMTYPTIDSFMSGDYLSVTAENMLDIIVSCIEQIYDKGGEEVHMAVDSTKKELTEFIEQLNTEQFKKVQKFFDTMPKLKHTVTVKNPETKVESEVILTGLNDFFE